MNDLERHQLREAHEMAERERFKAYALEQELEALRLRERQQTESELLMVSMRIIWQILTQGAASQVDVAHQHAIGEQLGTMTQEALEREFAKPRPPVTNGLQPGTPVTSVF